jgi:hypothetical protein
MALAVTQNTNDNKVACDEKNRRELEPKLPSEKFSVLLVILLEYLQVQDEANYLNRGTSGQIATNSRSYKFSVNFCMPLPIVQMCEYTSILMALIKYPQVPNRNLTGNPTKHPRGTWRTSGPQGPGIRQRTPPMDPSTRYGSQSTRYEGYVHVKSHA